MTPLLPGPARDLRHALRQLRGARTSLKNARVGLRDERDATVLAALISLDAVLADLRKVRRKRRAAA